MQLKDLIAPLYLRRMTASPRGRAFILNQAADSEDSDEGTIFSSLLSRIDDDKLRKMVRIHEADEKRHAVMFRECAERAGVDYETLPQHMMLLDRLDKALDGFFDKFVAGEAGVMEAYVLLQVIEERAVTQFKMLEPAFRRVDPRTADVFLAIARDEERHLKYCRAISKRYAPDEATLTRTLRHYRNVEAQVFVEHSQGMMEFALDSGILGSGPIETRFWRGISRLAKRAGRPDHTPFSEPALQT